MVPGAGLEPARPFERGILNPLCLPISPPGQSCVCRCTWQNGVHFKLIEMDLSCTLSTNSSIRSAFIQNLELIGLVLLIVAYKSAYFWLPLLSGNFGAQIHLKSMYQRHADNALAPRTIYCHSDSG
jgi:hypothetical protein